MEFLGRMEEAIQYIEDNIANNFDYRELAKIVCCNTYQFGRIFSYVTGLSLAEYIRNRRLSLAAVDLQNEKVKVIDLAYKYGYSSPEAFARAFREIHGISPKEASVPGVCLKMYPRISFTITIRGDIDMEYRIEERGIIKGVGISKNFGIRTPNEDAEHWTEIDKETWLFWDHFLDFGENIVIRDKYNLYRPPLWQMGVYQTTENGELILSLGAEDAGGDYPELTKFEVPASTWAVFSAKGTLNQNVHPINALTTKIYSEWFPSSGYEKSMDYEIQVYGPGNTQSDDYVCDLWIPVKKKQP